MNQPKRLHSRNEPIELTVDGTAVSAYAGESVAALLLSLGERTFTQPSSFNLPRTLYCGMGLCHQCLVTINGVRDLRACMTTTQPGMVIETELHPDLTKIAPDRGYIGRETLHTSSNSGGREMRMVDVAIIGGGPAGMAAAAEMVGHNVNIALIDAYPQLGGHYFRQPPDALGPHALTNGPRQKEFAALRETIVAAVDQTVYHLPATSIWHISREDEGFVLHLIGPHKNKSVEAKVLLVAAGAYDRPFPVPGWHLPGVLTLGGVQMLLKGHGILPGKRILVGGSGPLLPASAAGLVKAGADVIAVLDIARINTGMMRSPLAFWGQWSRWKELWAYGRTLQKAATPIKFGQTIFEILGKNRVEAVSYGPVDADGRADWSRATTVEVDTVCAALGFLPNIAITRLLKCDHRYDAQLDAFYPVHTESMESSVSDVFVAGDITGVGGKDLSKMQGQIAAWHILQRLAKISGDEAASLSSALRSAIKRERQALAILCERMRVKPAYFTLMQEETIACRCEMVTVGEIREAIEQGATDLRGMKLRTRCGMGACQSRYCEQTIAQLIMQETGADRESVGTSSIRPPIIPIRAAEMLEKPV